LGAFQDKVKVTGNLKFDNTKYTVSPEDFTVLKQKLGLRQRDKLLVAGSTHEGEEEIVFNSYKDLLKEFPDLKLLIAPRHPERANEIEKIAVKNNFSPMRVSQLNLETCKPVNGQTIFVLDTVGQLMNYYAISDIVFVGGSLIKKGGHNILEPASLGKPVIFGPYMFNFRDISDLFIAAKACILIHGKEELSGAIKDLLINPEKMQELGRNGRNVITQNQGAVSRTFEQIKVFLSE
jgi:3-deoxy-D-manno-octulosonic-acid transferase